MSGSGSWDWAGPLGGFLESLRFPQLFLLVGVLLLFDLVVPDPLPFVDEALLALVAMLLGKLRRSPEPERPPEKDVTPGRSGSRR